MRKNPLKGPRVGKSRQALLRNAQELGIQNPASISTRSLARATDLVTVQHQRERLKTLVDQGLCVGTLVTVGPKRQHEWVVAIDIQRGIISSSGADKQARERESLGMEIVATPSVCFNPDEWAPAGFQRIPQALSRKILAGGFDEQIKNGIVIRASFFGSEPLIYLADQLLEKAIQLEWARSPAGKREAREEAQRTKFCTNCGKQWNGQSGHLPCEDCVKSPRGAQYPKKYCPKCGTLFEKGDASPTSWTATHYCPQHRTRQPSTFAG